MANFNLKGSTILDPVYYLCSACRKQCIYSCLSRWHKENIRLHLKYNQMPMSKQDENHMAQTCL